MEFLALPILIGFVYAVYSFSAKPHFAVACILIISVINAWFIEPPSVLLGLNIYLHDLVFVPLFLSTLIRFLFKHEWPYASPLWFGYGLILFYGLFIGLKQYGTLAGVDFRNIFYYWAGTLYFLSFAYTKEMINKIVKYWLLICSVLLLIVYFRFVAEALHLPISATWIAADSTGIRFRVVHSEKAFLLGVTVIVLFYRYVVPEWEKPSRILTVLFLVAVIALQHRSVWGATLLSIASMFLLPGIKKHKLIGKLTVIGIVGMILLLPLLFSGFADSFINSIGDSAERASNLNTGTFGARRKGWERIIVYWTNQDFIHQLLGDPFGGGYAGLPQSPHNFFLQSLLRTGILGNFLICLFYLGLFVRLYIRILKDTENRLYPTLFFMFIVAQVAYYIPYAPQAEHGILLGIAASLTKRRIETEGTAKLNNKEYFLNTPGSKKVQINKYPN